jgi:hypothetical protein
VRGEGLVNRFGREKVGGDAGPVERGFGGLDQKIGAVQEELGTWFEIGGAAVEDHHSEVGPKEAED